MNSLLQNLNESENLQFEQIGNHAVQTPFKSIIKRQANSTRLILVADMRDELGLFSDESMDGLVGGYIDSATEMIEKYLEFPIINSDIVDYFLMGSERFLLSKTQLDPATISPIATIGNGVDRSDSSIAQENFVVDESQGGIIVYIQNQSLLENLTTDFISPMRFEYPFSLQSTANFVEQVKQALRVLVGIFFERRGGIEYPEMKKITGVLDSVLGGVRKSYVAGA